MTIGVVVGGHAFDLITDLEHWPFSQYPMYSYPFATPRVTAYHLYGVDERGAEFALADTRYLRPLNVLALGRSLRGIHARQGSGRLVDEALRDSLARYEARRAAGRHNGPPLRGIRLYRLSWELKAGAPNRDCPGEAVLIHEVLVVERGAAGGRQA